MDLRKILSITALSAVAAFGMQQVVHADGWYIGTGVYESETDYESAGLKIDDTDTVPAFFVGYTFIDSNFFMLAAELGYYDLGEYEETFDSTKVEMSASAATAAGVLSIPIGPFFEIYGKAGLAAVEVEVERSDDFKTDDDGSESFAAVGFAFDILDTVDIYAEYMTVDTEIDSELLGIGVRFAF